MVDALLLDARFHLHVHGHHRPAKVCEEVQSTTRGQRADRYEKTIPSTEVVLFLPSIVYNNNNN